MMTGMIVKKAKPVAKICNFQTEKQKVKLPSPLFFPRADIAARSLGRGRLFPEREFSEWDWKYCTNR
jgi:hypothetical protein